MKVYGGVLSLDYLNPEKKALGWCVTHLPTNAYICLPQLQREGQGICLALLVAGDKHGWDWHNLTRADVAIMREVISPTVTPPEKVIGITPMPVLGYTPSPEVLVLTKALERAWQGAGDFVAAATAFNDRRDWEVNILRMTTGKRAILLPTDVPIRAHAVTGVPCDLPNCKRLFRELMGLGTQIDDVAGKMQGLIAVGEPDGRDEDQWLALDKELVDLIYQGWMTWGTCVCVFSSLSLTEQTPFIKRLGFLGSQEKGWHSLGVKTFLRSDTLRNIRPIRREVKRRLASYGE